jgi:hypothetical protein
MLSSRWSRPYQRGCFADASENLRPAAWQLGAAKHGSCPRSYGSRWLRGPVLSECRRHEAVLVMKSNSVQWYPPAQVLACSLPIARSMRAVSRHRRFRSERVPAREGCFASNGSRHRTRPCGGCGNWAGRGSWPAEAGGKFRSGRTASTSLTGGSGALGRATGMSPEVAAFELSPLRRFPLSGLWRGRAYTKPAGAGRDLHHILQ